MNRLRRFLSDLTLLPAIYRGLIAAARNDEDSDVVETIGTALSARDDALTAHFVDAICPGGGR